MLKTMHSSLVRGYGPPARHLSLFHLRGLFASADIFSNGCLDSVRVNANAYPRDGSGDLALLGLCCLSLLLPLMSRTTGRSDGRSLPSPRRGKAQVPRQAQTWAIVLPSTPPAEPWSVLLVRLVLRGLTMVGRRVVRFRTQQVQMHAADR